MFFQPFVDIEHGVARLIKAGQQLIDHNQQFDAIGLVKGGQDLAVVRLFTLVLRHHVLPEGLQLGQGGFINAFVALAGIGRGDDHGALHFAKLIQERFVLEGNLFAGGGQLGFAPGALMVLGIMFANIKGDLLETLFGLVDFTLPAEFHFEIPLLVVGQGLGGALKPAVNAGLVRLQLDQATFVDQRNDRLVSHGLAHGIFVNEVAKLGGGALLFFE